MANPLPLVGLPGDDLAYVGTASVTAGTADAAYPVTNALDDDPANICKATGNSLTIRVTTPSAVPLAVAAINTNAETLTFDGGSMPIPTAEPDGQRRHPWLNLRLTPPSAGTTWDFAFSRASGVVWVGRLVLLVALYELPLKYGLRVGRNRPGDVEIQTRLGSVIRHGAQIRRRWARGQVDLIEAESLMRAQEASAKGSLLPFLFIPDEATNDAWFVRHLANDWSLTYPNYDVREVPFGVEEVSSGPPNG
jgi:hypothetical protein